MPKGQPKTAKTRTALGSDGKDAWLDLSDYLVHFARGEDGYNTMLSILGHQVIRRGNAPFGCAAKRKGVDVESQRVVCFSEIPLGFLHRLVRRRKTSYGIAFHKGFVIPQGGAPLWYLELGTPQQRAVSALMSRAAKPFDQDDPIWSLTPFIDFPSRRAYPYRYDFRWEREWLSPAGAEGTTFIGITGTRVRQKGARGRGRKGRSGPRAGVRIGAPPPILGRGAEAQGSVGAAAHARISGSAILV